MAIQSVSAAPQSYVTLQLDDLDKIDERMNKALAIIDLMAHADISAIAGDSLPSGGWAASDLLQEARDIISGGRSA